ncbi:MAG: outer membrane beta-barrel protein [Ignavibacteriales bacterium]|nr:outer membrane beta-barrel protein [Ignavibacteriales bacterium]
MKKNIIILTFLIIFGSINLFSQNIFFKFDGGIALPMGKMSDSIKMGFGGLVTCGYDFDQNVAITLTSGYLYFPGKEITSTVAVNTTKFEIIPILVGTKYSAQMDDQISIYGKFDIGVFVMSSTITSKIIALDYKEGSATNTETKFGIIPSLGAEYKIDDKMAIDCNISFNYLATEDKPTEWLGIFAGIKYTL